VQQRSVEFSNLFGYDQIRRGVLERMPPPEIREEQRVLGESTSKRRSRTLKDKSKRPTKQSEQDILLDLMGGGSEETPSVAPPVNGSQHSADLLADILGSGRNSVASPPLSQTSNKNAIIDLFDSNGHPAASVQSPGPASSDLLGGASAAVSSPSPPQPSSNAHAAFNKNGLLLTMQVQRNPSGSGAQVLARFRNTSDFNRFRGVGLQAAVPKSQRLQLNAINKADLDGGDEGVQGMKVAAISGTLPPKLRLRLRLTYSKDGSTTVTEQVDWTEP